MPTFAALARILRSGMRAIVRAPSAERKAGARRALIDGAEKIGRRRPIADGSPRRRWPISPGRMFHGHGIRLPVRSRPPTPVHRLSRRRRQPRFQFLRSAGVGSAACKFRRHRQRRFARQALVPSRTHSDADRRRLRPDLLVRIDVRISDALAGHARARRQPAGTDQPAGRAAAGEIWRRTRRALGHVGIGIQCARHRADLPIFRASAFPISATSAGSAKTPSSRPMRAGLPAMVDPAAAARNFKRMAEHRRARRLWLV